MGASLLADDVAITSGISTITSVSKSGLDNNDRQSACNGICRCFTSRRWYRCCKKAYKG